MLTAGAVVSLPYSPPVRRGGRLPEEIKVSRSNRRRDCVKFDSIDSDRESLKIAHSASLIYTHFQINSKTHPTQATTIICAAALNARCAAEQTQTVTRQAPTITHIPGKEKSPQLDDGGTGLPPGDDGDGGGGGGGGGGNWSGGFFFFGFLAFLGFLKDKESEGPYRDDRRR